MSEHVLSPLNLETQLMATLLKELLFLLRTNGFVDGHGKCPHSADSSPYMLEIVKRISKAIV